MLIPLVLARYSEWIDECERVNNLEDDGEDQDEDLMPRKRVSTSEWD